MKPIFKVLFFVVCLTFFACTKKQKCKKMPKISGDIIEEYWYNEFDCYDFSNDETYKKKYSANGNYFFYNESSFQGFLDSVYYNSYSGSCERPVIDFSKFSLLGFRITDDCDQCDLAQKVDIDSLNRQATYFIYNCSGAYCRPCGIFFRWVKTPKIDSTYKINYIYEKY